METQLERLNLLRQFRAARHMTQQQAAEWWGCETGTWSQYERGVRRVPRPLLLALHRAL